MADEETHQPIPRRRRVRETSRRVVLVERFARLLITAGGLGTILAVSLVCLFLIWVVVPLFAPPSFGERRELTAEDSPVILALDEYQTLGWTYSADGTFRVRRLDGGRVVDDIRPFGERTPISHAFDLDEGRCAFGFEDGTIRLGSMGFTTRFLDSDDPDAAHLRLEPGEIAELLGGIVEGTPDGELRLQRFELDLEEPVSLSPGSPVVRIDRSALPSGDVVGALSADGILRVRRLTRRKHLMTGRETVTAVGGEVDLGLVSGDVPRWLLVTGLGDNVLLAWTSGLLLRYDAREVRAPELVETVDLVPEVGEQLTALGFLIGKTSIAAGDSRGRLRIWFRIRPQFPVGEGDVLVPAHEVDGPEAPVTALAASVRTRALAAGYANGVVRLFFVTSDRLLAELRTSREGVPIRAVALGPRDDSVVAVSEGSWSLWPVDAPHPEVGLGAMATPIWYEGYPEPAHVWQSSSGTDDFEPKFGLFPLVFGTAKATLYSLLFGLPLALLAAVFTSEFMHPRMKGKVKPTIELMASLPSVVLGFLAALVIAPFAEDVVPAILCAIFTLPFVILVGAHLWQMIPREVAPYWARWRGAALWLGTAAGFGLALAIAGPVEDGFFGGDLKHWLSSGEGSATGGWVFLMLPASGLLTVWASSRVLAPRLRAMSLSWSDRKTGIVALGKLLIQFGFALSLALGASALLAGMGLDARGGVLGTYVQRNALVVGFVMGFAIIPIIYTIAEDALSAVPDHLRAASMGAGATVWQTAVRIVVPTAMSGLFSAAMIGLGRAVGETMIVLMAAGNTPILDWNVFSGFRTLSANIAVELPEAVQGSTHYRMLFLAGFVLFAMTFLVNTVAEIVRLRFRKRAYEL